MHSLESKSSLWWLLLGISLIATVSIRRNFELTNPSIAPTTNVATKSTSWKKVTDATAIFYSKIFLNRDKTFIYVPLKFENQTQVTWLSLESSPSAKPSVWLMAHPTLEKLDWSFVNDETIYLYQKQKTYSSIADFLKNPPPSQQLLVEKSLRNLPGYTKLQGKDLTDTFDPNTVDYILTTFKQSVIKDGALYYENIVDATNGRLNKNDKLTWLINVATATKEKPFYLGEIHVDYR